MSLRKRLELNRVSEELWRYFADDIEFRKNLVKYRGVDFIDYKFKNIKCKSNIMKKFNSIKLFMYNERAKKYLGDIDLQIEPKDLYTANRYFKYENAKSQNLYTEDELYELLHNTKDISKFLAYALNLIIKIAEIVPEIEKENGKFLKNDFLELNEENTGIDKTLSIYEKTIEIIDEWYPKYKEQKSKEK